MVVRIGVLIAALLLSGCVDPSIYGPPRGPAGPGAYPPPPPVVDRRGGRAAQAQFFTALSQYCGKAYAGQVVTQDGADSAMRREPLILDIRSCNAREIRMPFHQGQNRSRTWIVAKTPAGLSLKHDHRERDGQPEKMTMYGGETINTGTPTRQEFPTDPFSVRLF
ncbi:MAG TPA: hypothetical protein DCL54_10460, partial [Alphaproteobacteria bacterium]|nr:hypothetical protein [Alphaproteobacteria bacterium]